VILTFPPLGVSNEFLQVAAQSCKGLLLGTTSVYSGRGIIGEDSAVNPNHARVPREEAFIQYGIEPVGFSNKIEVNKSLSLVG